MDWDLTSYFPSFDSEERKQFAQAIRTDIEALTQEAVALAPLSDKSAADWERVMLKQEELGARFSHLWSYVGAVSSCDATNAEVRAEEARLSALSSTFEKLNVQLMRAVRDVDDATFDKFVQREGMANSGYAVSRVRQDAQVSMEPALENLAADLSPDGFDSWGRLYDTVSSSLKFDMTYPDGRTEQVPMAQRRSLMGDADRRVREAAFVGGNRAWETVGEVCAASLNALSGTRHALNDRRGINHFLDVALFQAAVSRETLEAMFSAIYANAELPRQFLALRAKTMGRDKVAWFDLEAPLATGDAKTEERIPWERATELVRESFGRGYPELGEFAAMALDKKWVEWSPRPGKRPGAYCTSSPFINESRVFMTYQGSYGDMSTLAHELGHAFHSYLMRDLRPMARHYPMTLAETASTFAEMLLSEGMLSDPKIEKAHRARLLGERLADSSAFLLDIPVRFEFEKAMYEERKKGELSVSRLCALMSDTQRRIFGDVLEPGGEDPYFWASKLHFFITGVTFYNFPYTFGYLLSQGLFAEFKRQGADFLPRYREFLRLTGSGPAQEVAKKTLGEDLEDPGFWTRSIQSLRAPLDELSSLV